MDNTKVITYSEVVYLFADKYVTDRSGLFNYDTHPTGQKISVKPLSHKMVIAAVAYLFDMGYLNLSVKDVTKLIFLKGKGVFGKKLKEGGSEVAGIEKILLDNCANETEISKAVYHLLDDDESSPWGQVVNISKNGLVEKAYLEVEKERKNIFSLKRYLFVENTIAGVTPLFAEVGQKLAEFSAKTEIYKLVESAVKNGIASRKAQSTSDD